MKKSNFYKAERLLTLRRQIDEIANSVYLTDDNHHGSACKPTFESGHLANAHEYLHRAVESINSELLRL
ncbi:MAG: hypothetical protein HDR46_01125 [Bacteroides sp.]|nr:hypothetical protein [Bacteroides sp.]